MKMLIIGPLNEVQIQWLGKLLDETIWLWPPSVHWYPNVAKLVIHVVPHSITYQVFMKTLIGSEMSFPMVTTEESTDIVAIISAEIHLRAQKDLAA